MSQPPTLTGSPIMEVLRRLSGQYRSFGLLALSHQEFRDLPFVGRLLEGIRDRSEVTAFVFQLTQERFGYDALPAEHPALPNEMNWPDPHKKGGNCGRIGARFNHCIASYMQAWHLQLLMKDDGFSTFLPTLGVMMEARSYRAGVDYLLALMRNGYIVSLREFSGAMTLVVELATRLGDDLFLHPPFFPLTGIMLEEVRTAAESRSADPIRALAAFDYLSEVLRASMDAAQRCSRNATEWVTSSCEVLALTHVAWDTARNYVDSTHATPERAATIAFIQEAEADVNAYFEVFHRSHKLSHNPGMLGFVWQLYRHRDPAHWVAALRDERFVLPDDLLPVVEVTMREDDSPPQWPPHWTTFDVDFGQCLCLLRGGHGEFVRFYAVAGRETWEMTESTAFALQPRLAQIVGGGDGYVPPETHISILSELDALVVEYPWSAAVRLERGVQKDELGQHDQAIADFEQAVVLEPTHWPNWRSLATACKRSGRLYDADCAWAVARGIREMNLPISRRS